jgi:hippurate hydrolase
VSIKQLAAQAKDLEADLIALRRELHQIPEFGLSLPKTLARVKAALAELGELHVDETISCASLVIRGAKPGPTVLLRADMDALAVVEDTGLPFASTNGYMHACGHDLHMAIGVGAARLLHANRDQLQGDVVFFFQSGEEGHGGADLMLERGMHLVGGSKPIGAYGIHVFSVDRAGLFASRPGALMASAGDMLVTFRGKASHGSMPWLGKDPITPMIQAIAGIQPLVTKSFTAFDQVIVNVGWIKAGDDHTTNVVPQVAKFGATIRTFSHEHFGRIRVELERLMKATADAYGVESVVEFTPASQVLINDKQAVARAERLVSEAFGSERYAHLENPIPGGEDFASIVKEIPGAFIFLGAGASTIPKEKWEANHSNKAVFDESVIADGAALLAGLAIDHLNEAAD